MAEKQINPAPVPSTRTSFSFSFRSYSSSPTSSSSSSFFCQASNSSSSYWSLSISSSFANYQFFFVRILPIFQLLLLVHLLILQPPAHISNPSICSCPPPSFRCSYTFPSLNSLWNPYHSFISFILKLLLHRQISSGISQLIHLPAAPLSSCSLSNLCSVIVKLWNF